MSARPSPQSAPPDSFYRFDDKNKEVLILRPDTPTPWMNYLSNGTFHVMISQAGGGVAFHRSPQIFRINRYRFFHLPTDRSGFYCYLRDADNGYYWCPTSEPSERKPTTWSAAQGLGYTRFQAKRDGISAQLVFTVSPLANTLLWNLQLTNRSRRTRRIDLFSYVEFGMMEFLREVSWYCYNKHQLRVSFDETSRALIYEYGVESQPRPDETPLVYFATDATLSGFDGDRDEFVGTYRSETNPWAIEQGNCTGSLLRGGDPCGALQVRVELSPGERREVNTFLGTAPDVSLARTALAVCRNKTFVKVSLAAVKETWDSYLARFQCSVPSVEASRMINIWNPYQSQRNFLFSRNISLYATGTFRGVGFRDTCQDTICHATFRPEEARAKVRELLGQQYRDGHTNHYYFPTEGFPPVHRLHSDNHLWPVLSVWSILAEEGKAEILNERVPFFDGEDATVYEHLRRSCAFSSGHTGPNGFPLMLHSDWNDMLFKVCREGRGESIWVSMLLGRVLLLMARMARILGHEDHAREYESEREKQRLLVNSAGWDGNWFRRAVMDDGQFLGTADSPEAKIWLNTQTWAVISGLADSDKASAAMDAVHQHLDTPLGIKKIHPPIVDFPSPADPLSHYNPGCGENAAIFCHANTWAIIAECLLGNGDRAWNYYRKLIPSVAMDAAGPWRYKAEPYVYCSNLFGPDSLRFGLANVSWLTGTAAWMHIAATQYILGIRPTWEGLKIAPCLPADWPEAEVTRLFRGATYKIKISNSGEKRVPAITMNGIPLEGNVVPPVPPGAEAYVRVVF